MSFIIVAGAITLSVVLAHVFIHFGEKRWNRMTDQEKLAEISKWRSVG